MIRASRATMNFTKSVQAPTKYGAGIIVHVDDEREDHTNHTQTETPFTHYAARI